MEGLQIIEPTMSANPEKKLETTELDALNVALKYIVDNLGISRKQLAVRFGLCRLTLCRVYQGRKLERAYDFYFGAFVRLLNEKRLVALSLNDKKREEEIDMLLRDLLLIHCGVPSDREIAKFERRKKYGVH